MRNQAILFVLLGLIIWPVLAAAADREILDGCQGEGCGCFAAYREVDPEGAPKDFDIKVIRPFTLYETRSKNAKLLGQFNPGIMARPLKQDLTVLEVGEYVVEAIHPPEHGHEAPPVKIGDKLDHLVDLGEGILMANLNGKWVQFQWDDVELRTIKETDLDEWLQVNVQGVTGFTQESPFEMCLE